MIDTLTTARENVMDIKLQMCHATNALLKFLSATSYRDWTEKDLVTVIVAIELEKGLVERCKWNVHLIKDLGEFPELHDTQQLHDIEEILAN